MEMMAKAGITTAELGESMGRIGKVMYEITVEGIKEVARSRGISYEEAEEIYFMGIRNRKINVDGKPLRE